MKTRAVILAGGEGSRLGVLTAKRTKPAVPFAGKYRIIDFTLSNCVNSGIFDVMILAQYRPHSLIEHIGAGVPWDLDRNFTGGVSLLTPYKGRGSSDWYLGTADAVQQNFQFIKRGSPDHVLILSGDHIYQMNYQKMIEFHHKKEAALTIGSIRIPIEDASRYGIIAVDDELRVVEFVEKPDEPPSNLVNMGVYLFNTKLLDGVLWEDSKSFDSVHDFGKDILPRLVAEGMRVYSYPFENYWIDVGTVESYWQAHMDLLKTPPPIDLNDRSWIVHTRTEERPPVWIASGAVVWNSLVTDGCRLDNGANIQQSVLSPGVKIKEGAVVRDSIILTDAIIERNAVVERSIIEKQVVVGVGTHIGSIADQLQGSITMVGKNTIVPPGATVEAGAIIGADVSPEDYPSLTVRSKDFIQTKRLPYEL